MRSRKTVVAIVLFVVIVQGGVIVGLTGSFPSSPQAAFSPAPSTQGLGLGPVGQVPSYSFAGAAQSGVTGGPFFGAAAVTTATMTATTTVAAGATTVVTGPSSGPTTVVHGNAGPQSVRGAGASLPYATATANGSRDIEFFTNITLMAASASDAFARASAVAYSVGGYVAYSTQSNTTALVELRVPAAGYQDALAQVESLGTLVESSSTSNDVTVQYTDLNATLQSLQAEQESLLKILSQSTNINATLNVESRIQSVDQQINMVQSEILQTRTLVAYATITAFIEQKAVVQPLSMKVTATPRSGESPLSVTFNAVTKGGVQPYIVNYNFGDGSSYQGQALIHTFEQAGHYNVTVTATDASANVTEAWTTVDVSAPPATSGVGGFPSFVGGLFLQVVEGITEVAVVVLPVAAVLFLVLFPLRHRLGISSRRGRQSEGAASGTSTPPQAK